MATSKIKSPSKLSHYVLQTARFEEMKDFYLTFLGAHVTLEDANAVFMTYDDEHHRLGIMHFPHLQPKNPITSGLFHTAFTFDSLPDLCEAYKQRKAIGIEPKWCIFHGPTLSMYYADPDGNQIEILIDVGTPEEVEVLMKSEAYLRNPMGPEFDPEEFCKRLDGGESVKSILTRPDVAPMSPEYIQAAMMRFAPAPIKAQ